MGIYLDVCFRCSWKKEGNGRIKCMIFFFKGRGLGFCCYNLVKAIHNIHRSEGNVRWVHVLREFNQ